jgi:predicted dehydrogenase
VKKGIREVFNWTEVKNENINGALITNPTSLHIETAIEIAKYGIPLFIEKPLGKDLEKIEQLETLVNQKNIPVLMGYNLIYHPAVVLMKNLLMKRELVRIISAKAQFGTYMPDWHKDEDYKKSYAANSSMGGGVVFDIHSRTNYLTEFFGEVEHVKAMGQEVILSELMQKKVLKF